MKKIFITLINVIALIAISSCSKGGEDEQQDFRERDEALIKTFLKTHKLGATETESGLFYYIDPDWGPIEDALQPKDDTYVVSLDYTATLLDDTEAIPNISIDQLLLSNATAGLREGLKLIKEGQTIHLVMPSHLAYGSTSSESIPSNSPLYFRVKLKQVLYPLPSSSRTRHSF